MAWQQTGFVLTPEAYKIKDGHWQGIVNVSKPEISKVVNTKWYPIYFTNELEAYEYAVEKAKQELKYFIDSSINYSKQPDI